MHTPGPWEYRERKAGRHTRLPFIVASESEQEVMGVVADVTTEPDAKLIAAAPDLLDALDYLQYALACDRDSEPIIFQGREIVLEEVKYLVVDPVLNAIDGRDDVTQPYGEPFPLPRLATEATT